MHDLPTDWSALCALAFLLGLRHGFDADHLATIDGLTRLNARAGRPFARWCGSLFSLGHGSVVIAIALALTYAGTRWHTPAWLGATGAWVSIAVLTLLGGANLRAALVAPPGQCVAPVGLKGRWLGRLGRAGRPVTVALVGALFALSFDTVSQAALFALAGTRFGAGHAAVLGLLFLLGMLVTDGLNGLWISHLITRADQRAAVASRVMSLAVAAVSLVVAGVGATRLAWPWIESWVDAHEWTVGVLVLAIVGAAYLLARRLARGFAPALPSVIPRA